mgnify:CR=1 FL=1
MSVNKAILVGRLGVDPELRTTGSGTNVVNMRMATTDRRKEGEQWVDHTEWHNITVWGRTADNVRFLGSRNDNAPIVQSQNTAFTKNDEHIPF